MTGKTFRRQVFATILAVLLVSLGSLYASVYLDPKYSEALRLVPAVIIPVGAAWLAFCWQRRVAFTKALFDVWQKVVVSVQDAIQYTHLSNHTQQDFARVLHSLSCRIDDIRGAFRNVGESYSGISDETKAFILSVKGAKSLEECDQCLKKYRPRDSIGVYPFETLKQMAGVIQRLGFGQTVTPERARIARNAIIALWGILRGELLKELDRDFPEHPDTPY